MQKKIEILFSKGDEGKKTQNSKLKLKSQHYKMSTSIFTGSVNVGAFDKAAKSLVGDYVRQALEFIADKYNFSAEDALRDLEYGRDEHDSFFQEEDYQEGGEALNSDALDRCGD